MNLQNLKLKASTLCAGGTLLVFGGFLTVNLAGCGGGGGGGLTTIPTPSPVGATFRIVQQDSTPSRGGTLTLTGNGQTFQGTADSNGVLVLQGVAPGTYNATFTAFNAAGTALPSTSRSLTITRVGTQNFVLVQGDTGNGQFSLTGTIFQNPNNGQFTGCDANSTPITANVLISVRDLNDTTGAPIIAQIVRPVQDGNVSIGLRGRYTISLPTNPRSFRVEVGPADNNGVRYAGLSSTTTFTQGTTTLANVNVCANNNGVIPVPFSPTPTPTINTATPLPVVTSTPNTTAGGTTTGTTTGGTTPTTPAATGTPVPAATATTAAPTPSFTVAPTVAGGGNTANTTTGNTTAGNTTLNNTTLSTAGNTTTGTTTTGNTTTSTTTTGSTSSGNATIGNTTLFTPGNTTATTTNRTRR